MPPSPLARVRKFCLSLPEATEKEAWGEPTWRVNDKLFAMFASASTHHGFERNAVWLKCTPTNQEFILAADQRRYFKPPYVGPSGWIGVYLDARVKWGELEMLIQDAFELAAPKSARRKAEAEVTRPTGKAPDRRGARPTRMPRKMKKKHG